MVALELVLLAGKLLFEALALLIPIGPIPTVVLPPNLDSQGLVF